MDRPLVVYREVRRLRSVEKDEGEKLLAEQLPQLCRVALRVSYFFHYLSVVLFNVVVQLADVDAFPVLMLTTMECQGFLVLAINSDLLIYLCFLMIPSISNYCLR